MNSENMTLVQHSDMTCVKKQLSVYDEELYLKLQQMSVPGIPQIYQVTKEDDRLIVIEEYIGYPTLADQLSEFSRLPDDQALDIALQICRILKRLHGAIPPIIHRDIKPSNVLLSPRGEVYLIDFDAAKTYDSSKNRDTVLMGTADYAAPEQFGFRQSDARTDIYGIGVLLNVLVTGCTPQERMHQGRFTKVISKCTAIDPSKRFRSVRQLYAVLEGLQRRVGKPEYVSTDHGRSKKRIFASDGLRSWLPPGFRSLTPWKMVLACIGYGVILWLGLIQSVDVETTAHIIFNRLCATATLLMPVFMIGNYRGISEKLPISRSVFTVVHIIGSILWSIVFMIALLILCVVVDMI